MEVIFSKILSLCDVVKVEHSVEVCRDFKDNKFIECALSGGVDYIISGDGDLLSLKNYGSVIVVNARDFIESYT